MLGTIRNYIHIAGQLHFLQYGKSVFNKIIIAVIKTQNDLRFTGFPFDLMQTHYRIILHYIFQQFFKIINCQCRPCEIFLIVYPVKIKYGNSIFKLYILIKPFVKPHKMQNVDDYVAQRITFSLKQVFASLFSKSG